MPDWLHYPPSSSYAKQMPELRVTEIFYSIQGESTHAGRPCVFVRLTGCDLRCVWCDTEYAFHGGRRMPLDAVVAEVLTYPTHLVEITGGEPLLQSGVHQLVTKLLDAGKTVLVETGGHRDLAPLDPRAIVICDIKCPDSGMASRNRWENLDLLKPKDEVKFVIASRADYEWSCGILEKYHLHRHHTVLFSPVWARVNPRELAEWILADRLEVQFQMQLHKLLWGPDRKGV